MTILRHILFVLTISAPFISCDNSPDTRTQNNNPTTDTVKLLQADDEDGPPFKNECAAKFSRFGENKISNDNCNIYFSGKGWNPDYYSCSWTWGELINNEFSEDTNVTFIKIHLLDLDKFFIPKDGSEYGHDSIKKYVITVYSRDSKGGNDKCIFDPYKTGKYPKPKQWVD
jgi:hypothetical protein